MFEKKEEKKDSAPSLPSIPSIEKEISFKEKSETERYTLPQKNIIEDNLSSEQKFPTTLKEFGESKDKAPFFVRIDKFNDARENLRMVSKRLKEMDKVLEKIQEVKMREDEELAAWKEEMKLIRENLTKIDEDIFSKL